MNSAGEFSITLERARERAIWVAFAVSVLIHAVVLWQWTPEIDFPKLEDFDRAASNGSLAVRLAPAPPPPAPPPAEAVTTPQRARAVPPAIRPAPRPPPPASPSIALSQPAAEAPAIAPPVPPVSAPAASSAPSASDFASFIAAQRNARPRPEDVATKSAPVEDERTRINRVAAANLSSQPMMTFGYDPNRSGGVFTVQRTGLNDAEFMFYGWNPDARRNMPRLIEVKRGSLGDIRVAVVRRMIEIIRETVHESDFRWDSRRLGRAHVLSARVRDTGELEQFLLLEFEHM